MWTCRDLKGSGDGGQCEICFRLLSWDGMSFLLVENPGPFFVNQGKSKGPETKQWQHAAGNGPKIRLTWPGESR
jgi:hypothetical protein